MVSKNLSKDVMNHLFAKNFMISKSPKIKSLSADRVTWSPTLTPIFCVKHIRGYFFNGQIITIQGPRPIK